MRACGLTQKLLAKWVTKQCSILRYSHNWPSNTVRSSFISFFGEKDHLFIPSSPVVPWNDNSLGFVNAGMNQFKSVLLGTKPPLAKRAVNSQKCIRVGGKHNDLSDVGRDTYHHTFFEMLGSWSFNDYFKEEACKMSWELLTQVFKIPYQHLYVTYFSGDTRLGLEPDEETKNIWLSIGVPEDRILPFGLNYNFWEMGNVGPCGVSTEIHFERHPSSNGASKVNKGIEDLIEIWNLVFIQYERTDSGKLVPLESQFVDTGMGLERITACLNGKSSNYDTDIFIPLFDTIYKMSGKSLYEGKVSHNEDCLDTYYRILADHSRMVSIALADGLLPHDNYNLRTAIRRSFLVGWEKFGLHSTKNFMANLLQVVAHNLGDTYPELLTHFNKIECILEFEEEQLKEVQSQISKDWPKLVEAYPQLFSLTNVSFQLIEGVKQLLPHVAKWREHFPIEEAVKLYENYFLSTAVIEDVAKALGFHLDINEFTEYIDSKEPDLKTVSLKMKTTTKESIAAMLKQRSIDKTDDSFKYSYSLTPDERYSFSKHRSTLLSIVLDGSSVDVIKKGDSAVFVLKSTNFYPKSGGQSNDFGSIKAGDNVFKVSKVESVEDYSLHFGEVIAGSFKIGDDVDFEVNESLRLRMSRLHTAHHLLRAAIEAVAGMAYQRASLVDSNNLRMNVFVHPPLQLHQLIQAEIIVKVWINQNQEVSRKTVPLFEALRTGSVTLVSGEKYPEDVHIISSECNLPPDLFVGSLDQEPPMVSVRSSEFCCGTHVFNTGHLKDFAITEFQLEGKGVSRISAVYGNEASKLNVKGNALSKEFRAWDTRITSAVKNNERLRELDKEFKKWKRTIKKSQLPITVFSSIDLRSQHLIELMQEILVKKSNWKELQHEFQDYISETPNGAILYEMKTDYRGPLENLETIMKDVSDRPAAFVCKGWGRVRACIYIPEVLQKEDSTLEKLLKELQRVLGGQIKQNPNCQEMGIFYVPGVKADKLDDTISQIMKTCSTQISELS